MTDSILITRGALVAVALAFLVAGACLGLLAGVGMDAP